MEPLQYIQQNLNCPKNQYNSFGGYHYRSCEDILEALKPLLAETGTKLTLSDDYICPCEGWVFIRAQAALWKDDQIIASVTSLARHEDTKKGMDASQISGAASSYARKYALNGLFLIDDTKDADATNTHNKEPAKKPNVDLKKLKSEEGKKWIKQFDDAEKAIAEIGKSKTVTTEAEKYIRSLIYENTQ